MDDARVAGAGDLAELLLRNAAAQTSRSEHRRARRLGRLLADPAGRELLFSLTDEVMRTPDATRALHRLDALLRDGVPRSLGFVDRRGLRLAATVGARLPKLTARVVEQRVRAETRGVMMCRLL